MSISMQDKNITDYTGIQELLNLEIMENYNISIVKDSLFFKNKINKIIDFGAGIGTLSLIFRDKFKKEPICIEIDKTNINYLKKRNLNFLYNDPYYQDSNNTDLKQLIRKSSIIIIATPHKVYKKVRIPRKKKIVDIWNIIKD